MFNLPVAFIVYSIRPEELTFHFGYATDSVKFFYYLDQWRAVRLERVLRKFVTYLCLHSFLDFLYKNNHDDITNIRIHGAYNIKQIALFRSGNIRKWVAF